ncbi:L-threonylcarbamoyladenylate synthase [Lutimonas vermicola]|uniref:L-threonylcarbamoyladenylate synthase n=1 Tax=Lutimonas vermicola TaxID=414288 RepID=A0ABU9KW41_9FLAO
MKEEINRSLHILASGGTLIYPTDTIWGLGCDATNQAAVKKIYKIKNRSESKSLIILVDGMDMLRAYVGFVPEVVDKFLKTNIKPITVIYSHPKGLAPNVVAADNTVAIRVVQNDFCKALIREFGKPIVSTSANFSGAPSPSSLDEIDPLLLKQVDYIVNLPAAESKNAASQIIKLNDLGEIEFLRK